MVVVSDTGPLHYLLITGHIEVVPALYKQILIPSAVARELSHPRIPLQVRSWVDTRPAWLHLQPARCQAEQWPNLDVGERESLALAVERKARLFLTDDTAGRNAASAIPNLRVAGTLGVLYQDAVERCLSPSNPGLAFHEAVLRLRQTNFFFNKKLDDALRILGERLGQTFVD